MSRTSRKPQQRPSYVKGHLAVRVSVAGALKPFAGTGDEELVTKSFDNLTGTKLHAPYFPKAAAVLELINGELVAVRIFNPYRTHESH